jgi:hypothetical protein
MNKFAPEEVYDSNKKFARRKSKPSNKMRLEANNYAAIYCGDKRLQPTTQPVGSVITRIAVFSDRWFLLVVREHGVVLSTIFLMALVEEEEAASVSLSVPEAILALATMSSLMTFTVWSVSLAMERGMEVVRQAVKDGKVREWNDGTWHA